MWKTKRLVQNGRCATPPDPLWDNDVKKKGPSSLGVKNPADTQEAGTWWGGRQGTQGRRISSRPGRGSWATSLSWLQVGVARGVVRCHAGPGDISPWEATIFWSPNCSLKQKAGKSTDVYLV